MGQSATPKVLEFGGPWSLIKTDMVQRYVTFFNTALKARHFERVYIDAFAGTGAFTYVDDAADTLFGDARPAIHRGSAAVALEADPPFHRILFIEQTQENVSSLNALIARSRHPYARVKHGDANEILREVCRPEAWRRRRGIIFLDPFGMSVEWATLNLIAQTKALDVWYLFPLAGTVRNLPLDAAQLDDDKRSAVTRILGTDEWYDEFYKVEGHPATNLFGEVAPATASRKARVDDIENFILRRLRTVFTHVEEPRRLKAKGNRSLFSLFFAISNSSPSAVKLARKGASHILKMR